MGPAPRTLEFFYDVLSPYSWLGFEVTPGLGGQGQREESAGRRVHGLVQFLALPKTV